MPIIEKVERRVCSICGKCLFSGYVVHDTEYYCSSKCLKTKYTFDEYNDMYLDGEAYWTMWKDD